MSASDNDLKLTVNCSLNEDAFRISLSLKITCDPIVKNGLGIDQLHSKTSFLDADLKNFSPKQYAVLFWVKPDSLAVFKDARDSASEKGFATNWSPEVMGKPITFGLGGGGGGGITVQ
jgi:hypothetical protein